MQPAFVLFTVVAIVATAQAANPNVNKVRLDVYYSSRCLYCHNFFLEQLEPTTKMLYDYMEVNLVPDEPILLSKIHACALERVQGDILNRVSLASCLLLFYSDDAITAGEYCSRPFDLNWSEVYACATGPEGDYLMNENRKEIASLNPPVTGYPSIAVNKDRGQPGSVFRYNVRFKLQEVVCSVLAQENVYPDECVIPH